LNVENAVFRTQKRRNDYNAGRDHDCRGRRSASNVCGTVIPSDFAVLKLITNSNRVGCNADRVGWFGAIQNTTNINPGLKVLIDHTRAMHAVRAKRASRKKLLSGQGVIIFISPRHLVTAEGTLCLIRNAKSLKRFFSAINDAKQK
jgi:hypothetical protein